MLSFSYTSGFLTSDSPTHLIDHRLSETLEVSHFSQAEVVPLSFEKNHLLSLVKDPFDTDLLHTLEMKTNTVITPVTTSEESFEAAKDIVFERGKVLNSSADHLSRELTETFGTQYVSESLEEQCASEPIVKLTKLIIDEAVELNASDIHIEPTEETGVVRFRIDGMLRRHMDLAQHVITPLTSRVKIMAHLDIAEKRKPQDGQIRYFHRNSTYDLRVSVLPTNLGEKTVIRLLRQDYSFLSLEGLHMPDTILKNFQKIIHKPQGIFLVTGPTGSGKTSTLFSALNEIKGKEINITTIENPIEYRISGINQVQVHDRAGITFAGTLRSILRQDPDVILIGETRDRETAEIALQAAQTGHLVFTTLHTNDALSALTRLRALGVPPYLIASSLLGAMAQRLVRRLCPHCAIKKPVDSIQKEHWQSIAGPLPFTHSYFPSGCPECRENGYQGRTAVFEMILPDDTLRQHIARENSEQEMRSHLNSGKSRYMIHHGIELIEGGITTMDEVLRVITVGDST
jgi:type IV pilus assembly protein PilB